MKLILSISTLLICCVHSNSQNLVPNPSFEDNNTCPFGEDQMHFVENWFKASSDFTTPDYFHACASPGPNGTPDCGPGYQEPFDGAAHIGLVTFVTSLSNYREHVGVELLQPLIMGETYYLSLYVSFTGSSGFGAPTNNFGIKLSSIGYMAETPIPIDNFSHVFNESAIVDSLNWTMISASIVADSAYSHLYLGNFFDDLSTDFQSQSKLSNHGYYYVDNICISTDSLNCFPVNVEEESFVEDFTLGPNPCHDYVNVSLSTHGKEYALELLSLTGELILPRQTTRNAQISLNLSNADSGIYILHVTNTQTNKVTIRRIIKY